MSQVWLVSRRFDLAAFVAPAALALALVPFADQLAPGGVMPIWAWVGLVLCVDVAHVWSTLYRTYFDKAELRRRPGLYLFAPIVAYGLGLALALNSFQTFWRGMAYLALFHFVRQQYGWMRRYGRLDVALTEWDRHLDAAVIYAATVFPVLWWHAHLPRRFEWFVPEDFIAGLPEGVVQALWPVYVGLFVLFFGRQAQRARREGFVAWGKLWLVLTTAACWGVGIMVANSDWAFTVTNVIIHGVPYVAFIWVLGRSSAEGFEAGTLNRAIFGGARWLHFLAILGALAYFEEYLWDRLMWQERASLFPGPELSIPEGWVAVLMPLLALPQVTHYLLDGFIWKRAKG